jgi:SAM-dependent methyltransferase
VTTLASQRIGRKTIPFSAQDNEQKYIGCTFGTTASARSDLELLKSLNLGCGTDIRTDCINLDRASLPGVDVVHDLTQLPWPFANGRFGHIVCQDILEHLDIEPAMRELHRILAPGGILEIRVPHFTSANTYADPTHERAFSINTLSFFCKGGKRDYYFDFAFTALEECRITFPKGYGYVIEQLVNISRRMQVHYESSLLRIFPAVNVYVRLRK